MILTISQMKQVEQEAFQQGVEAADLMEQAGAGIAAAVEQFFSTPGTAIIYCGKGHNGGDALVAARFLAANGWKIFLRLAFDRADMALLSQSHLQELEEHYEIIPSDELPEHHLAPLVLIDGLLGLGAQGVLHGRLELLVTEMNRLRSTRGAFTVAVDIPSGLDGMTGGATAVCVKADLTIAIAYAKKGLVADRATNHVGRLAIVQLAELKSNNKDIQDIQEGVIITSEELRGLLPSRSFDVHKGMFGHVGILAGSRGYLGAARLASVAALHAGAGLVTLFALPETYELLASIVPPEIMVKPIASYRDLLLERLDALAMGPGLSTNYPLEILELIEKQVIPCVVDADALNILAQDMPRLLKCQGARLLTPHPGEMERLFPAEGRDRATWATQFVDCYPVTLLLKGARTVIAEKKMPHAYNTTGTPGMATGGMGDVLTGVTGALLAGGHSTKNAAMLGTWLCGRAAEIAVYEGTSSAESLTASDVITHLGMAMKWLREGGY